MKYSPNFTIAINSVLESMRHSSNYIHTDKWQGVDISKKPEMAMHELLNYSMTVPITIRDLAELAKEIKPNLPWADDHFLERVCGYPLNPGKEWANWPYAGSASTFLEDGKFNHSYMERYWPRHAGFHQQPLIDIPSTSSEEYYGDDPVNIGVQGVYGDLGDVVKQLVNDPMTRQAYLPVFFPEDTGAVNGGRIPCSLGYHFIMRGGYLHVTYWLRSCDLYRHMRDDIYLTVRLLLWVLDQCSEKSETWKKVQPGIFTMHITSLHCFKNDFQLMFRGRK